MTWIVLETIKKNKRSYCRVQCTCGNLAEVRKDWVESKRSKECKSCSSKRTAATYGMPSSFKGIKDFSKTHFSSIKIGADKRGISFEVTLEFLWDLFLKQDKKCALTGQLITLVPSTHKSNPDWVNITASVDRIDSSVGYIESNVHWVHKDINRFKNNYSMQKFLSMCQMVCHHVNPDPSVLNGETLGTKEQRLGGEEPTNNPPTSARHPTMDDDIV